MKERRHRGRLKARSSQLEAFEHFFKDHYHDLFRYAFSLLGSEDVAEDVIQDLFVHLWETDVQIPLSKSYLYRSVRNRSLDVLKSVKVRQTWARQKAELAGEHERSVPAADNDYEVEQLSRQIELILSSLPAIQREIFLLSRYHGLTYKEIAAALGITELRVKKQMSKALGAFRSRLQLFLISCLSLLLYFQVF